MNGGLELGQMYPSSPKGVFLYTGASGSKDLQNVPDGDKDICRLYLLYALCMPEQGPNPS